MARFENVNIIAAVGKNGQLGLDGGMPWYDANDLAFFRERTMGCPVIMGSVTMKALASRRFAGRAIHVWRRDVEPAALLQSICISFPGKPIWIAGGRRTYEAFMPYARRAFVTLTDYTGNADTIMPPLWQRPEVNWERIAHAHAARISSMGADVARLTRRVHELEKAEPVAWLRDVDGTGSLHPAAKDDPGAFPVRRI